MRLTNQRQVLLQVLNMQPGHPSADEVYERVRQKLPRVSLGTIYRNLELMSSEGLIRKIDLGCGMKRYDSKAEYHSHFKCTLCDSIEDIPENACGNYFDFDHEWFFDRKIEQSRLDVYGVCPKCGAEA